MSTGLVGLDALPRTPDPHTVLAAAAAVLSTANAVQTACDSAEQTWRRLPASLSAPGAIDSLSTALTPVTTDSAALTAAVRTMYRAVETFAGEVQAVRRRSAALEDEITAFYLKLGADLLRPGAVVLLDTIVHALGREDELDRLMDENDRLSGDVTALNAYWLQVQQEAASALLAITGGEGDGLPRGSSRAAAVSGASSLSAVLALESLAAAARQGPAAVREWRASHPDLAALLQRTPPDAVVVNGWWTNLPTSAQLALVAGIPTVIGDLDGVGYGSRSTANVAVLTQTIADYEGRVERELLLMRNPALAAALARAEPGLAAGSLTTDAALLNDYRQILAALKAKPGTQRSLIELDTSENPPLAAVAIGDLDRAQNVTYLVPGMSATTKDMVGWTGAAQNVYTAQTNTGTGSFAVVAWMGYVTPPIPTNGDFGVLGATYAQNGADRLDAALAGANAVRSDVTLNVVAHSYGTTTASYALAAHDENVHSLVMLGSAGIPTSIPDAEAIHADRVYAGQATDALPGLGDTQGDQYAWVGRDFSGRLNPVDPSFDATTFGTDGKEDGSATTAHDTNVAHASAANGHGYLDNGTESLYNVAQATTTGTGLTPYVWSDYTHLTPAALLTQFKAEVAKEGVRSVVHEWEAGGIPSTVIDSLLEQAGSSLLSGVTP